MLHQFSVRTYKVLKKHLEKNRKKIKLLQIDKLTQAYYYTCRILLYNDTMGQEYCISFEPRLWFWKKFENNTWEKLCKK